MARKPTGSSTASQESTPHLDDKSADEPEARARPSASDPDNVPETLCDGGFNIWVHNDHATITFTHRRPKADLLLGEWRIVEEFVVRARIVMSLRGLAQFRTTIDQTLQAVAHRSTTRQ